jgi:hypothetical protein
MAQQFMEQTLDLSEPEPERPSNDDDDFQPRRKKSKRPKRR